jgi:hypothetical protein
MVELPNQFHFFPALLRTLCHVVCDVGFFHFFKGIEDAKG